MKTAQIAKAIGFKNLEEAAKCCGVSTRWLRMLHKTDVERLYPILRRGLLKKFDELVAQWRNDNEYNAKP